MEEYWNGNETSEGVTEQRGPAIADLCEPMGGPPQLIVVYRNAGGCEQVSETNMPMRWLCKGGLPSLTHASLSRAAALTLKRSGSGSGFGGRLAALISSHDFSFRVRVRIWAASRMDPKVMVWENEIVFEYIKLYLKIYDYVCEYIILYLNECSNPC